MPDIAALYSTAANSGFSFYMPAMPGFQMPFVFESGLPDPSTFPVEDLARLTESVLRNERDELQYGTPVEGDLSFGNLGLRQQLVERTARIDGRTIDPSWVMLTGGGVQGISLAAQAFLDRGDHIVVESPTWEYVLRDAQVIGAQATAIPLDEEGLRIDLLEDHIRALESRGERLKVVYTIATFNVPTGISLSLERRRRLVELAAHHNFVIVEDNVYGDLRYDGETLPSLFSLDEAGMVVKIDSFSKTLNPALRLGWVTGHPYAVGALDRVRRDLGVGQLLARVLRDYLSEGLFEPHLEKVNALYRVKRDRTIAALDEYCRQWVTWNHPDGGFFLWLSLSDEVDGAAVAAKAAADGVMCRVGERFYGEDEKAAGAQRLRLAFTTAPVEELERAAAVLGKAASDSVR